MENETPPKQGIYYRGMATVSLLQYGGDRYWHSQEWIDKTSRTGLTILKQQQQNQKTINKPVPMRESAMK